MPARAVALLVALVVASLAPASGAGADDPRSKQREVQRQKARKAQEVDVLKASDEEVEEALDALNAEVRAEEARAVAARQAAEAATAQAAAARAREEATTAALGEMEATMKKVAVDAYMRGPTHGLTVAMDAPSLQAMARRQQLMGVTVNKSAETADQLRAAREDLEIQRAAAEAAEQVARERRQAVDQRLHDATEAVAVKERVASAVDERLERALAEADSLDALDRSLSAEIKARQARLAARVGPRSPTAPRASRGDTRVGAVSLTTVRGITVATEIAGGLERLMAAAEADGFSLGGGGYRSSDGQIAIRRANCGTSDYAIYQMPASACSPPTARPGASMHERGLAVDFTSSGALIQSRSNPAFQWLARNAAGYGLYNLPAEPWHWSSNGN